MASLFFVFSLTGVLVPSGREHSAFSLCGMYVVKCLSTVGPFFAAGVEVPSGMEKRKAAHFSWSLPERGGCQEGMHEYHFVLQECIGNVSGITIFRCELGGHLFSSIHYPVYDRGHVRRGDSGISPIQYSRAMVAVGQGDRVPKSHGCSI